MSRNPREAAICLCCVCKPTVLYGLRSSFSGGFGLLITTAVETRCLPESEAQRHEAFESPSNPAFQFWPSPAVPWTRPHQNHRNSQQHRRASPHVISRQ